MSVFSVNRTDSSDIAVLYVSGDLDTNSAPILDDELAAVISGGSVNIVLCMKGIKYISSAGLYVISKHIADVRDCGGDIKMTRPGKHIFRVFELIGYQHLYDFFDEVNEALCKFAEHPTQSRES